MIIDELTFLSAKENVISKLAGLELIIFVFVKFVTWIICPYTTIKQQNV